VTSLAACAVFAQPPRDSAPPLVNQPADFSQVVGTFTISTDASPTKVAVEEPIELRVTIRGQASPPHVPRRALLKLFPADMHEHFFVEPGAEQAGAGIWRFDYRLRPKSTAVSRIPGLKLVYYAPRQGRYQSTYSDEIPVQVTPRPAADVAVPGLNIVPAPPSFFELAAIPPGGAAAGASDSAAAWLALLLAPPLLCGGAVWAWRRSHPELHELRQRRRHRAAQQALTAIAHNGQAAAEVQLVLTEYLRDRLDFPTLEPTPPDVDRWLKRRGVRGLVRQRWRGFFQECAAARFTPPGAPSTFEAAAQAAELIHELEADPCVQDGR
jgi:hypothetical protein